MTIAPHLWQALTDDELYLRLYYAAFCELSAEQIASLTPRPATCP